MLCSYPISWPISPANKRPRDNFAVEPEEDGAAVGTDGEAVVGDRDGEEVGEEVGEVDGASVGFAEGGGVGQEELMVTLVSCVVTGPADPGESARRKFTVPGVLGAVYLTVPTPPLLEYPLLVPSSQLEVSRSPSLAWNTLAFVPTSNVLVLPVSMQVGRVNSG